MPEYICEKCKKVFGQKIEFTRHLNKKMPCVSNVQLNIVKSHESEVKELITFFKNVLDLLRNNEHLIGDIALANISYLSILRMMKTKITDKDFEKYFKPDSNYGNDLEKHKNSLKKALSFKNLYELSISDKSAILPLVLTKYWKEFLCYYPKTNKVFLKENNFDIKKKETYIKLIKSFYEFPFEKYECDVLGTAYEHVFKTIMTGDLGQFFTPPASKNIMVNLINPQILDDGTIESYYDPAMGTGGFLMTIVKFIEDKAKSQGKTLNMEKICNELLGGREAVPRTYQLAKTNMFISTGFDGKNLELDDSIRNPTTKKWKNILTNPPFGIDGLNYDDIDTPLRNEYYPVRINSAVPLFLQLIIKILDINGKCAIVLPDGQELFNKNQALVAIREYLVKTCDLKEIISFPAKTFSFTDIKTVVAFFVKKRDETEVLKTNISYSKTTNKETKRIYEFTKTHQTKKVKFYDFNPENKEKTLLLEVPIEKIAQNKYSLNYNEYREDETEEEQYEEGVVVKTLGEVCDFQNGKRIVKGQVETGEYPVLGGGGFTSFYTNEYSREGKTCKISREGMSLHNCVMLLNEKYYLNSQAFTIKSKNKSMINEYLWYYLDNNKEQVFKCGRGSAQKAIDIDEFKSIKIPIPSLERQKEIVKYLDFIYEKANKTSNEKIAELKQLNEFCLSNQKIFSENVVKTLGEVFGEKTNNYINVDDNTKYNIVGLSSKGYSKVSKQIFGSELKIKRQQICKLHQFSMSKILNGGYGYINNDTVDGILSNEYWLFDVNTQLILKEYLYYIFETQIMNQLKKISNGVGIPRINREKFKSIKIQIPSLERQKEIVEYCESNDALIKQLEKEIENNKKLAQQFITGIVKAQVQTEE